MKEDKQEKYLKYIIQELVNNTYVDVRDQKIWHPYDEHYSRHLIGELHNNFLILFMTLMVFFRKKWNHYGHNINIELERKMGGYKFIHSIVVVKQLDLQ